jgi:hypothetical protein
MEEASKNLYIMHMEFKDQVNSFCYRQNTFILGLIWAPRYIRGFHVGIRNNHAFVI